MAEWSNAHAWKACEVKVSAGSNPVLSANARGIKARGFNFLFFIKKFNLKL